MNHIQIDFTGYMLKSLSGENSRFLDRAEGLIETSDRGYRVNSYRETLTKLGQASTCSQGTPPLLQGRQHSLKIASIDGCVLTHGFVF